MSSLPYELLTLIFCDLKTEDLLQCQLTNKQWRKASLTRLYSDIIIGTNNNAFLYVRTISNSPPLRNYLNTIDFGQSFEKDDDKNVIAKPELLDTIIQYCPNITKIEGDDFNFLFWNQIMLAATRGHLSRLKVLPQPESRNLKLYISTALLFKNSLTTLRLQDEEKDFGYQLTGLKGYQTLCDEVDQFKNLQFLFIWYLTDKYLSYFDGLIDKCHHLRTLTFTMNIERTLQPNELEPTIHPRPDIHTLECTWEIINGKSQLEYVMQKFPNLKSLKVMSGYNTKPNCSHLDLMKFIRYIILIPNFEIKIAINKKYLPNICIEFINTKNGCKNITIACSQYIRPSAVLNNLELSTKAGLNLVFPLGAGADGVPHIKFFSEAGRFIRLLTVKTPDSIPRKNGETSDIIDWLFDILHLCPLMEEIIIYDPSYVSSSRHTLQYPSVKKLTINEVLYARSINFLSYLSLNLPNLRQLSLNFIYTCDGNMTPIIIHMPYTSLDMLTWKEKTSVCRYIIGAEVFIKLATDKGKRFYMGIRDKLFPVNQNRYLLSTSHVRFDIYCKHLKELRIRRSIFPESDSDFVF